MNKNFKKLLGGLTITGVIVLAGVNFKLNESSNKRLAVSNLIVKNLDAYTGESSGESSSGGNTSTCWSKKGTAQSGKHFTKCKSGTSSNNTLICDGLEYNHNPDSSSKGKCHPSAVN